MPFSVVGNFWFKKLCNIFDSWYILPTRQSLQNQIYQIFENHHNLIAKELSELTVKVLHVYVYYIKNRCLKLTTRI